MNPLLLATFFALWGALCLVVLTLREGLEWLGRRVAAAAPPQSPWEAPSLPRLARTPA